MRKLLLPVVMAFFALQSSAQDQAIFSHYNINPILINPGVAGFGGQHQAIFNARMQWVGFEDAPRTFMAQYNGPLGRTFGIGIGVLSETAAELQRVRAQLNYAFRFKIQDDWDFGVGFSTELHQLRLNNAIAGSNFFDVGDRIINANMDGIQFLDASIGIYSSYRENTFGGLSLNNLVRSRLDGIVNSKDNESFLSYYIFYLGHRIPVADLKFNVEPSIMVRQIKDAPFQVDINFKAGFLDDQLMAGVSYRSLGVLGVMLGARVTSFNLYYTYDVSFQRFQQYNSGAHEVTVALDFKSKDKQRRSY